MKLSYQIIDNSTQYKSIRLIFYLSSNYIELLMNKFLDKILCWSIVAELDGFNLGEIILNKFGKHKFIIDEKLNSVTIEVNKESKTLEVLNILFNVLDNWLYKKNSYTLHSARQEDFHFNGFYITSSLHESDIKIDKVIIEDALGDCYDKITLL